MVDDGRVLGAMRPKLKLAPIPEEPAQRHLADAVFEMRPAIERLDAEVVALNENALVQIATNRRVGATLDAHDRLLDRFGKVVERVERRLDGDSLPPSRSETPSQLDLRKDADLALSGEFQKIAKKTPGANVESTPEHLTAVATTVFDRLLAEREEALRVKADRERLAAIDAANARASADALVLKNEADKARRHFKRTLTYGAAGAFVLAIAAAAGTATWVRASALAEGHAEGMRELRASTPAMGPDAGR